MEIRPMRAGDVEAAFRMTQDAFSGGPPPEPRPPVRIAHLLDTDPGGCWVADDGALAGVAIGIVREGLWGLSLLVVRPDVQARGVGRALMEPALAHGAGTRGGLILSSTDPRAMRRYARAGFALRPCVAAAGTVDRSALPALCGAVRESADAEATAPFSRAVRGATHAPDVPAMLASGGALLRHERGFAVHAGGTVKLLAALDDDAARALLWGCLAASGPGATVGVDFLTAGQDWAVEVCLAAGLALSPDGPLFARGDVGPLRPYVPSGAYL
jgi:GNAT superfamily N-acetyltransferase